MAREERIIYVYDDFSCDEPVLLGKYQRQLGKVS